jgi:uncharacterized protein Veg
MANLKLYSHFDNSGASTMLSPRERKIRKRNYYVIRTLAPNPLVEPNHIFALFKNNWSDRIMDYIVGCKAIVLDERKKGIAEVYFEPDNQISDVDIKVFFKIIKEEIGGAKGVMIAINNIAGEYQKNKKDVQIAERFSSIGSVENIHVEKSYLISSMSLCELV